MSTLAAFNIVVSSIGLVMWVLYVIKFPNRWRFAMWAMIYLLNVLLFYIASGTNMLTPEALNTWSSSIRIYVGVFCILIPVSIMHYRGPLWISYPS